MNFRRFILVSLLTISVIVGFSQGYEIKVHLDNLTDSTIYLGNYFGDKQYAKDTAVLDNKGNAVFTNEDTLPGGLYFILVPGNKIFEIVIDKDQQFSVSTTFSDDPAKLTKNLKSKGSDEMAFYIGYQQFMTTKGELAMELRKRSKDANDTDKKVITDSLELLHSQVKGEWKKIHEEHPESLLSVILKLTQEIEIPQPPKDEDGNVLDSMFRYKYYKAHFFDYVDFSDPRILRTQFYNPKIERYFKQLVVPAPDSIIKESRMILDKAAANEEVFQYTLSMMFNKYNNSNIMGMDKVFVFYAENYYLNGVAHWADSAWLEKIDERVREIKPNLIGNKAAEIKLLRPDDTHVSLYMVDAEYTVLFFYEPSCGHCKKATGKLKLMSEKFWEKGVEIMAIYTQVNKEEWTNFIKEKELDNWINAWDPYHQSGFRTNYDVRTTPTVYLLNKEKEIIGKRIDVETLEKILNDEFGIIVPEEEKVEDAIEETE